MASGLAEILRIEGRSTDGRLEVVPYYWDPVGLAYVVAQQASAGGGGGAATIADGADVAQGATTDAEAAAGNGSVIALLKRIRTLLGGTLAVSGTVTANAGTNLNTSALALDVTVAKDATLTGGTQKSIARGGAKGTTAAADVTSTAQGANNQAMDVQLYHGGAAKDPTAIRALTSSDVVTAAQGAPAAVANAWPVAISPNSPVGQVATTVSSVLQTTANTAQANQINLAAPGAGLFHYIDQIIITRVNNTNTAVAGDTTVRQITSANLGGWAHEMGSALAAGASETFIHQFPNGLKAAVANTATQISTPAGGAGTKIRITVIYRIGP